MKDLDRPQHLQEDSFRSNTIDARNDLLPESEMADTEALGGCCSRTKGEEF